MTLRTTIVALVVAVAPLWALFAADAPVARADHQSYVVQPVYVYASDQPNRFSTYQSKLNGFMTETTNWYSHAHLSANDTFKMNLITWRTGGRTLSSYCQNISPCTTDKVFNAVLTDLGNPASMTYLGYNPATAKNVITEVFFDGATAGSFGLGLSFGTTAPYDPDGLGGFTLFGAYVMDSSATKGAPGHDGTIAHETGHALRLPHSPTQPTFMFGSCALMGANQSWCWDGSTNLVNTIGSDGSYYYEQYAVHYSPFTRIAGATSPATGLSAFQTSCGIARFQWTLVTGDSTSGQTLLIAPRSSLPGATGPVVTANIFTGSGRTVISLPSSVSMYDASLSPGTYVWTIAPANAVGWVHSWPNANNGVTLTC